jgi:hypothetical protein
MLPQRNTTTGPYALEIGSLEGNVLPEPVDIPVDEAAPVGSQVMDAIGQLVSALNHNWVAR